MALQEIAHPHRLGHFGGGRRPGRVGTRPWTLEQHVNHDDTSPMTAAHSVDAQLATRLDQLRTLALGEELCSGNHEAAARAQHLPRALLACVVCMDAVRGVHPLDADGWCVVCTAPPGAANVSTIYGCYTRVTLGRHLVGLYTETMRPFRLPRLPGSEWHR